MVGIIGCWELGRTGNWDEDFGGIPSSPSLDGIEQQWFAFAMPLTSPDRARTVCGSLLAPPRRCFPLCSVAWQRGSLPGLGLGRAATANKAMRCDEKFPRSLELLNKSCCCCTTSSTRESQVQDDAPSRAQTRTDQAPGPGRGEEGRMR